MGLLSKSSTYLSKVPFLGLPGGPSFETYPFGMSFSGKNLATFFCHTSHLFNRKRGRKEYSGSR